MKNKEGQNVSDKNQEITFLMALERGETKRILIADTSQGRTVRTVQYCIKTKQNFLVLCNVHSFNS